MSLVNIQGFSRVISLDNPGLHGTEQPGNTRHKLNSCTRSRHLFPSSILWCINV